MTKCSYCHVFQAKYKIILPYICKIGFNKKIIKLCISCYANELENIILV